MGEAKKARGLSLVFSVICHSGCVGCMDTHTVLGSSAMNCQVPTNKNKTTLICSQRANIFQNTKVKNSSFLKVSHKRCKLNKYVIVPIINYYIVEQMSQQLKFNLLASSKTSCLLRKFYRFNLF